LKTPVKRILVLGAFLIGSLYLPTVAPVALPVVTPVEVAATCAQAKLIVYADTSGGGSHTFCFSADDSSLSNNLSTACGPFPSWNDCISRVTFDQGTVNTAVCLWTDNSFGGNGLRFIDDRTNYILGSTWADKVSSIEWGNNCLTD
jgi:hypothetical protein